MIFTSRASNILSLGIGWKVPAAWAAPVGNTGETHHRQPRPPESAGRLTGARFTFTFTEGGFSKWHEQRNA